MLVYETIEISKDIYNDITINNNGIVTDTILQKIFNQCMLCGYGVYSPHAIQQNKQNQKEGKGNNEQITECKNIF